MLHSAYLQKRPGGATNTPGPDQETDSMATQQSTDRPTLADLIASAFADGRKIGTTATVHVSTGSGR